MKVSLFYDYVLCYISWSIVNEFVSNFQNKGYCYKMNKLRSNNPVFSSKLRISLHMLSWLELNEFTLNIQNSAYFCKMHNDTFNLRLHISYWVKRILY